MAVILQKPRRAHRPFVVHKQALQVELLEARTVPSAMTWPGLSNPVASAGIDNTLDQAQDLGDLSVISQLSVVGRIANATAQVDWYTFTLDNPTRVTLTTHDVQARSPFISELSLYNADSDPTSDPYALFGWRLLTQDDGANHGGDARIDRSLAPGTYYVAVSGSGNRYFHPDIAGSGIAGSTGAYDLSITGQDLGFTSANGPAALVTDLLTYPGFTPPANNLNGPVANAVIGRSPFLIRVDMSEALDPNTINPGSTLQLMDITTGQSIPVTAYFDFSVNELKVTPAAPLRPDEYQLILSGNNASGAPVIQDLAGNPLGSSPANSGGQDYVFTFQVTGSEGIASTSPVADGTPATAHELGDITQASLVQETGTIGDDPSDPTPFNPADIDLYHFHLSGAGNFTFRAVVFAGRIGSLLDSEVSLFRLDPTDGLLHLIGLNDNTDNTTVTSDGSQAPLGFDSALTMALTAGDYYLAVTGSGYVPAALTDAGLPGPQSVFDPTVPEPFGGFSTGDYVVNLSVLADNTPPQVKSVTLADGSPLVNREVLSSPPTFISVTFSEPVSLEQQALQAFQQNSDTKLDSVYVVGASGTFYPRFSAYADNGNVATFKMFDALPNGVYQLHLSGPLGLTDLAGNPLLGNSTSGDYVVSFMVNGPPRGSPNNPLIWVVQDQRNIDVVFPNELQQGVKLQRPPVSSSPSPVAGSEAYQVQVLQDKRYTFVLSSTNLPPGIQLSITDASGNREPAFTRRSGQRLIVSASLLRGVYTIHVSGWSPKSGFTITISIIAAPEPAPPLTVGPEPAVPLRGLTGVLPPPLGNPGIGTNGNTPSTPTGGTSTLPVNVVVTVSPPGGGQTGQASVPAEVLLGLGAGQLGGVPGTPNTLVAKLDAYDRLIGLGPDPSFAQLVVQLPILTQASTSGLGEDFASSTAVGSVVQELVRTMNKINWATVTEFLQRLEDWSMEHMLSVPADNDPRPGHEAPSDARPSNDLPPSPEIPEISCWPGDTDNLVGSGSPDPVPTPTAGLPICTEKETFGRPDVIGSGDPTTTQALAFAAALAVIGSEGKRQGRKPVRSRCPEG